jgi:hypothetical protein
MIIPFLALLLAASSEPPRVPVLVELFTSEGCSSCPPADALLQNLVKAQPVSNARIIVLEEHVDYWNHLGWRDPFSSADFSRRQQTYNPEPYTPQMVIDGHEAFVGSEARQAIAAIGRAGSALKAEVQLRLSGNTLSVAIPTMPANDTDVVLAITEDELASDVARGENAGRHLGHAGVVRQLSILGHANTGKFSSESNLALSSSWNRANLHAVVFAQDRKTHRVLGVSSLRP